MGLRLVYPPKDGVYRVSRDLEPFKYSEPPLSLPKLDEPVIAGNRWDDPDGSYSTLYCATTAECSFAETIARYREKKDLLEKIDKFLSGPADVEYDFEVTPGVVPEDYVANRTLGHADVEDNSNFVDVDHTDTHGVISKGIRPLLDTFDLASVNHNVVCSRDRRISRPIARCLYGCAQTTDYHNVFGIRYVSRLSDEWECWAMWEPTPLLLGTASEEPVTWDNTDLQNAAKKLGLSLPT